MAQLKKELSYPVLLLLAINSMLGTGILFLPGFAAFIAGPASLLAWIGAAVIAIFIAMCFAELSGMMPRSGGVYEYTKQAFGGFAGFMTGWMTWIVANVSIAMFVSGGFIYLGAIFNMSELLMLILSIAFILGITYVSYRGIGASGKTISGLNRETSICGAPTRITKTILLMVITANATRSFALAPIPL